MAEWRERTLGLDTIYVLNVKSSELQHRKSRESLERIAREHGIELYTSQHAPWEDSIDIVPIVLYRYPCGHGDKYSPKRLGCPQCGAMARPYQDFNPEG